MLTFVGEFYMMIILEQQMKEERSVQNGKRTLAKSKIA